jgi:hypothetical protein
MKHTPEELEQKIRGMLFLAIQVVNWEKNVPNAGEYNGARKNHLIETSKLWLEDIYNDRDN